jgi:hypothetical protein
LKEKINRKTTMNLGLPSSDFKKRREKRGGKRKNLIDTKLSWIVPHASQLHKYCTFQMT